MYDEKFLSLSCRFVLWLRTLKPAVGVVLVECHKRGCAFKQIFTKLKVLKDKHGLLDEAFMESFQTLYRIFWFLWIKNCLNRFAQKLVFFLKKLHTSLEIVIQNFSDDHEIKTNSNDMHRHLSRCNYLVKISMKFIEALKSFHWNHNQFNNNHAFLFKTKNTKKN